jgi:hypothetical protein
VIAGQDQQMLRLFVVEEKKILIDRVRSAFVPIFAETLLRRDGGDVLAELAVQHVPAQPNMAVERMGLVLNQDSDLT